MKIVNLEKTKDFVLLISTQSHFIAVQLISQFVGLSGRQPRVSRRRS